MNEIAFDCFDSFLYRKDHPKKRFTHLYNGVVCVDRCDCSPGIVKGHICGEAVNRLAAYENTGLTPKEIKTLQEDNAKLQKLIDRDTAKRVDEDECCPICHTYGKDEEGVQGEFCPNCGQRLDWGDDNA